MLHYTQLFDGLYNEHGCCNVNPALAATRAKAKAHASVTVSEIRTPISPYVREEQQPLQTSSIADYPAGKGALFYTFENNHRALRHVHRRCLKRSE
jgi:hypothetical protein